MHAPSRSPRPPDARSAEELAERLAVAHFQLAERDAEIRRLVERDEEIAELRAEVDRLRQDLRHTTRQLQAMSHTRAWRAITLYWRVRGRLLGK